MLLKQAKEIAVAICYKLQPHCEKINIAGSLRRKKEDVKDIEIICLPKETQILDLFGSVIGSEIVPGFKGIIEKLGKRIKGHATGKMMQIELPEHIMLDLFIPDDFDYYRQYAIRTGSAAYSQHIIASGWLKIGFCGSDKGLRKQDDCEMYKTPDGKNKWRCINPNAELPPRWESEKEFFDWIKTPYIEPSQRNL